jgi:hypothetical protein
MTGRSHSHSHSHRKRRGCSGSVPVARDSLVAVLTGRTQNRNTTNQSPRLDFLNASAPSLLQSSELWRWHQKRRFFRRGSEFLGWFSKVGPIIQSGCPLGRYDPSKAAARHAGAESRPQRETECRSYRKAMILTEKYYRKMKMIPSSVDSRMALVESTSSRLAKQPLL